jgi:hypothetical protein
VWYFDAGVTLFIETVVGFKCCADVLAVWYLWLLSGDFLTRFAAFFKKGE